MFKPFVKCRHTLSMAVEGNFFVLLGVTAVLSGMFRRPLKTGVSIVGEIHPRYVVVNNRKEFWDGTAWTTEYRKALIYAHANLVQADVEDLRQRLCQ